MRSTMQSTRTCSPARMEPDDDARNAGLRVVRHRRAVDVVVTEVTIARGGEGDRATLTFDPGSGRIESEAYMDGEGLCTIGFDLTVNQRRTLAILLLSQGADK